MDLLLWRSCCGPGTSGIAPGCSTGQLPEWSGASYAVEKPEGRVVYGNNPTLLQLEREEAYALSREGYEAGRYSWLELIDARQHLSELRIRHSEAVLGMHRIDADLSKFRKEEI